MVYTYIGIIFTLFVNFFCKIIIIIPGEPHSYCIKHKKWYHAPQSYQLLSKWHCAPKYHFASFAAIFNRLNSSTNQQFKKHLCNQSSHYENTVDFHYKRKLSCANHKINTFINGTKRMLKTVICQNASLRLKQH